MLIKLKELLKNNWVVVVILFIAFVLRLWKLGSIPPGLTPDEASLGYNAYSILKTGRDEYGKLFPIIFKSFGDYKPGLYVYLTVPFVALLGLNEFAVRLPGALSGVIAVWLVYKIVGILSSINKSPFADHKSLAIISAAFLAISPWHIHFSRGAWEINVALTLTLGGIYFFLKALSNSRNLLGSALLFALTLLTYQGAKLSTLIVVAILTLIYWKEIYSFERRDLAKSVVLGLLIGLPIIASLFSGKTGRLKVFSVFSYSRPEEQVQTILKQVNIKKESISFKVFYSESINYSRMILGRWFNHFSPRLLFFEGDWQNPRQTPPNQGILLLFDLVLLPLGFFSILKKKLNKQSTVILLWLVLAPLPAVLTRDEVQVVRAYHLVIPFTLISSYGLLQLLRYFQSFRNSFKFFVFSSSVLAFFSSFIYFVDAYFVHLPKHDAKHWFYGYKQVVEKVTQVQDKYKTISFQQSYDQPYIYFLFHQKHDPKSYQEQASLIGGGVDVGLVEKLDKIRFIRYSWPAPADKGDLVIGNDVATLGGQVDPRFKLISEIKYPNDMVAFRILEAL